MPIVPTYKDRQVRSTAMPNNGLTVRSTPNDFGADIGEAVGQYGQVFAEAKQRANVALSQDALLQWQTYADDQLNNPQTGLYSKQGRNAMGQSDEVMANLSSKREELMASLPEGARADFSKQANVLNRQYATQINRFEIGQIQAFETSTHKGSMEMIAKKAATSFQDPKAFISHITLGEHNIVTFGRSQGQSEEEIIANVAKFKNQVAWQAGQNAMATNAIQTLQTIGEPSDVNGAMRVPGNPADNRGGRNNNPGNLRVSDNLWDGQIGDDGEYVQFATPEHGVRALGKNLLTYRDKGVVTLNQIIHRWAPKKDGNNTEAYIADVASRMNIDANVAIDVTNIASLKSLATAIMQHEGKHSITDAQINTGLQAALGLTRLPEPDKSQYQPEIGKAQAGSNPWWRLLTPVQQYQLRKQAETVQNKQRQEFKTSLTDKVKDANAMVLRGLTYSNPPSLDEFKYAYGEHDGIKEYEQFQHNQGLAADIATVQYLSPQAQQALLAAKKPTGDDDAANNWRRYDLLNQAINSVNKTRTADPIQFSIDRQQINKLDFSNVRSFTDSLNQRSTHVADIAKGYQTPLTIFSAQEQTILSQLLDKAPASQKIEYLDAIRQGLKSNQSYTAALKQISQSDTSLAVAGIIMNKPASITAQSKFWSSDITVTPTEAAQLIVQGNMIRKLDKGTEKFIFPKETELRENFADKVGDAFAGDISGANKAFEVAKDVYAALMAKKGDINGELDNDAWMQAINIATGGIHDYQGMGKIMLPWGMSADAFDNAISNEWNSIAATLGKNRHSSAAIFQLQNYGDSQYLIIQGSGYLRHKNGQPVIIDVSQEKIRDVPL
ncbi:hypothetical protein QE177_08970 [Arsenophonus sp. aPb]|uniref:hypothetical protein n=1 Tax=Arsenophonus sp. aPb TaxID=3041619 RepID=UPI002469B7C0|nr:hypothetical protein [Arsenophonus sp. aPb]WGL97353.1 hypothetical protein QE177_08970 [Arsenophonus sp. aPb]